MENKKGIITYVSAGSGVFFYVSINLHIKKAMLKYNYEKMEVYSMEVN